MLRYKANGVYETSLASGDIEITSEEIYDLLREITKHETIPYKIHDFDYNSCWTPMAPKSLEATHTILQSTDDEDFNDIVDTQMDEIVNKTIVQSQTTANEYYRDNYILVEKYN